MSESQPVNDSDGHVDPASPAEMTDIAQELARMEAQEPFDWDSPAAARLAADRLKEAYRAQGIQIPGVVLREGIRAYREGRFTHRPVAGFQARLARMWIRRRSVRNLAAGALLVVAGIHAAIHFGWTLPAERRATQQVREVNVQAAMVSERSVALSARLSAARTDRDQAFALEGRDRLDPRTRGLLKHAHAAQNELEQTIVQDLATTRARLPLQRLQRRGKRTEFVDAAPDWATGQDPEGATLAEVGAIQADLDGIERDIVTLEAGSGLLERAITMVEQLDSTNERLREAGLERDLDRVRESRYQTGNTALAAGDMAAAEAAVRRLADLEQDAESVAYVTVRLAELAAAARGTGVGGADLERLQGLEQQVRVVNTPDTVQQTGAGLQQMELAVRILQQHYTYRIVDRDGIVVGLSPHTTDAREIHGHYLVIEAVDQHGAAAVMPIQDEQTGEVQLVNLFAVRVPEAEFERVAQEKMLHGAVRNPVVGVKQVGALAPKFSIPTAGGYLAAW